MDNLPQEIENLETQIAELSEQISQPDFYRGDRNDIAETETRLSELQQQLSHCYDRWESLENL